MGLRAANDLLKEPGLSSCLRILDPVQGSADDVGRTDTVTPWRPHRTSEGHEQAHTGLRHHSKCCPCPNLTAIYGVSVIVIFLLSYNSRAIKFTSLKCTIQFERFWLSG